MVCFNAWSQRHSVGFSLVLRRAALDKTFALLIVAFCVGDAGGHGSGLDDLGGHREKKRERTISTGVLYPERVSSRRAMLRMP